MLISSTFTFNPMRGKLIYVLLDLSCLVWIGVAESMMVGRIGRTIICGSTMEGSGRM